MNAPALRAALLPCPFCGGEAESVNYVIEAVSRCTACRARIVCAHGMYDDNGLPEAIAAWNRRPAIAAESPGGEAVAVRAKAIEWNEEAGEWSEDNFGFYVGPTHDPDGDDDLFTASWGEGPSERFATLEEAKACCQQWAQEMVESTAEVVPAPGALALSEGELQEAAAALVYLVEGPGCIRWQDASGYRLKDTPEWVKFYVAAKRVGHLQSPPSVSGEQ